MATKVFTGKVELTESGKLSAVKVFMQILLDSGGGIKLSAHIEQLQQTVPIIMDATWTIHGVNKEDGRFAFQASPEGAAAPLQFVVRDLASQPELEAWFNKAAHLFGFKKDGSIPKKPRVREIPPSIVFITGLTMYVPGAITPQITH